MRTSKSLIINLSYGGAPAETEVRRMPALLLQVIVSKGINLRWRCNGAVLLSRYSSDVFSLRCNVPLWRIVPLLALTTERQGAD